MLSDYDMVEQLGPATHLAICRRGRLRTRKVVLREEIPSARVPHLRDSETIHQKLHHPSIVSLLAIFETPLARYHALDFCEQGSLAALTRKQIDQELLRDITRSISSALEYLRREFILHRNVSPESILLTHENYAKLSNFEYAVRLSTAKSTITTNCGKEDYSSPEMKAGYPYSFATDIWSLGCVLASCVTGTPSLGAAEATKGVSGHLLELLEGMLHISPSTRIQVHEVISHPFVADIRGAPPSPKGPLIDIRANNLLPRRLPKKPIMPILSRSISATRRPCMLTGGKRAVSETTVNVELRNILTDELASTSRGASVARRIVSEPLPRRPERMSSQLVRTTTFSQSLATAIAHTEETPDNPTNCTNNAFPFQAPPKASKPLPIGVTRPSPLNTHLLPPQSHKTIHGQITILQCRSLLVDFRESQRKDGQNTSEVLVISPEGLQIDLYLASNSEAPSLRGQPQLSYVLEALPSKYWQQYNDAARLVEEVKRRTPQLILYTPTARCTLWANGPPGDIELLFRSYLPLRNSPARFVDSAPTMRIRFSRNQCSVELMRYVESTEGGEWVKKDFLGIKNPNDVHDPQQEPLEDVERDGFSQLSVFLRQCESIEAVYRRVATRSLTGNTTNTDSTPGLARDSRSLVHQPLSAGPTTPSLLRSLNVTLVPRPSKTAYPLDTSKSLMDGDLRPSSVQTIDTNKPETSLLSLDIDPMSGLSEPSADVQTRFIPSTGWCIRYDSRVSQGGRFKIMFLDGATLDINVDEDWAEFMNPSGIKSRHGIRDCNSRRQISDRFRQFEAFLSLFEK